MRERHRVFFASFQLDLANEQLTHQNEVVRLTRKAFEVLRYFVMRSGELVTKDDLVANVWKGVAVTDSALTVCIRELRRALGDQVRTPQCIETVYGRGYRFIAPVVEKGTGAPAKPRSSNTPGNDAAAFLRSVALVGRETEWQQLQQWFTDAQNGTCQIGFIAGEPGIGKTALMETFFSHLVAEQRPWIGYGQCIEPYGIEEPYLPLLEALGRLCRGGPQGSHFRAMLWQHAPSWLAQMPTLLTPHERHELAVTTSGSTQARMLRELTEALQVLTTERPLVLILEDVHWSDRATVAWLAYVARHRGEKRLLVLSAYRPGEVMARAHPLHTIIAELRLQGLSVEMQLDSLSEDAVATYLGQRCGMPQVMPGLPATLHQRTRGNPFFLRTMIDELLRQGFLEEVRGVWVLQGKLESVTTMVPGSARALIEQQIERLPSAAQDLLETASVAGPTFAVEAVAAGSGQASHEVARQCERWARQGYFLQASGMELWPDGTRTVCYRFRHDLYYEVLYERVSVWRRAGLHRDIGLRKETGYGAQSPTIAAELARHFEQAQDVPRAMTYLRHAATSAAQRSAHDEAIAYLQRELAWLVAFAPSPMRLHQELTLQVALGTSLFATKGWAAPEVCQTYEQARALCQQQEVTPERSPVLYGLFSFYFMSGNFHTARTLGEEGLQLAQQLHDADIHLEACCMLGGVLLYMGEYSLASTYLAQGRTLYNPQQHREHILVYGLEPGVVALSLASWTLSLQGYLEQAEQCCQQALALGQALTHAHSRGFALMFAGWLSLFRRQEAAAQSFAAATMTLGQDYGFPHILAEGMVIHGRTLLAQGHGEEGVACMVEGMATFKATGAQAGLTMMLALLAEGCVTIGRVADGLGAVTEGLTLSERTGEHWWSAELQRLRGTLLLAQGASQHIEAEACLQQALAMARQQQAKLWEIRASISLARLWQSQGKCQEAVDLLAPVYHWFTEGLDLADLQEARVLLEELDVGIGGLQK